ncbi:MAG: hypothetical protein CL462_00400 [Acidimicrobiaceae bacterium]|nr:hypothetical protein [Acidimicrobiaceae bacterium]
MIGQRWMSWLWIGSMGLMLLGEVSRGAEGEEMPDYQYQFEDIRIPRALATEPKRSEGSVIPALRYIEQGATAWTRSKKCVTCHTNGTYLALRPSLTGRIGKPSQEVRDFFVTLLKEGTSQLGGKDKLNDSQLIYITRGLAEWDAYVLKKLSVETKLALKQLFDRQLPTGEWKALGKCWPPLESSAFQEATVAALAIAVAPGWLSNLTDEKMRAGVERLRNYFRKAQPPHDYGRVVLLWASAKLPGILDDTEKAKIIKMIGRQQQPDGGWSIRTFAHPEQWGNGNRAEKLRAEKEFESPPSDGHQTGLSLIALSESGVSARDPKIRKGVQWLLRNQRESGRWWTRSLNTDNYHFITYSGTLYPLVALHLCDGWPEVSIESATALTQP